MKKISSQTNRDSIVKGLLLCGWFALFIGGMNNFSGSWLTYTMFSVVFLAMLISGFYRQVSYGYLFLVVMLWLGFWLKLTIHLLVDYPFGEPVGFFIGTPVAWDEVLLVATIGSMGVLIARLLYGLAGCSSSMLAPDNSSFKIPVWYLAKRKWIWAWLMLVCVSLAIINASFGILQFGIVPATILLWPLNALISWLILYGLALGVATLLWWDVVLGRNVSSVVYFVLLEAFIATITLFSRGSYIFHVVPQFLSLYKNRELVLGWSRKNIIAVSIVFVMLFAISNPLVNTLRAYYYSNVIPVWHLGGDKASALAKFAVDRWIGLEGVMSASAYMKKGKYLFVRALTERAEIGKSTVYQEVCQSHYRFVDMKKFQFSSLPGAMGFLYFTGYLWVVALGMIVLVLAVLGSEGLVFKFTSNPLLSALWGGMAANIVAQIGIAPRGLLIYLLEMFCGVAAICFVQSNLFSELLQKYNALKRPKSL